MWAKNFLFFNPLWKRSSITDSALHWCTHCVTSCIPSDSNPWPCHLLFELQEYTLLVIRFRFLCSFCLIKPSIILWSSACYVVYSYWTSQTQNSRRAVCVCVCVCVQLFVFRENLVLLCQKITECAEAYWSVFWSL